MRTETRIIPTAATLALMLLGLCLFPARGEAPEALRQTMRRLVQQSAEAIVSVRVVVTQQMSFGGQASPERESQSETDGTVISPDGLTLVPLSAVDPAQFLRNSIGSQMSSQMNINSRVKDLKLILNKRTELPATVVLRDIDLNIALLRPTKKPDKPMNYIDLTAAADAQLLEPVAVLARLGRVADREIAAMTGEIQSIITKPRKFYVPSSELATGGMGVPIFNAAGRLVGIVLARTAPGAGDSGGSLGGQLSSNTLVIILPAKDVKEVADQAPKEAVEAREAEPAAEPAKSGNDQKTSDSAAGKAKPAK